MRNRAEKARGFSFVELMLSLVLLAILATVAVPMIQLTQQRQREQELAQALREIRRAIDDYRRAADQGRINVRPGDSGFPPSLEALEEGVVDEKQGGRKKIFFLRRLPRDPLSTDPRLAAGQTWGLRSSQSTADDPREGDDVFDVYSRARGVGRNGVPYRQW